MSISDATTAVNAELASRADMIISDGVDKWYRLRQVDMDPLYQPA